MKTRKFIFRYCLKAIAPVALISLSLSSQAMAHEQELPEDAFLQDIQDQLTRVSGMKDRHISIHVTQEPKRKIDLTPSSVSFSYGFLKNMENINQLIATMTHMTAHISLDSLPTPPLPEDGRDSMKKTSVGDYIKSTVQPRYPDENNIPQATGAFHDNGPGIIERPGYQNKDYDYSVNKAGIIKAEYELEADKATGKIMKHAGFCASDYNRMLHYFYEHPHRLLGNKHFALDADQWQRLDAIDRRIDPRATCSADEIALTRKYAAAFDRLKVRILQALNKRQDKPKTPHTKD